MSEPLSCGSWYVIAATGSEYPSVVEYEHVHGDRD